MPTTSSIAGPEEQAIKHKGGDLDRLLAPNAQPSSRPLPPLVYSTEIHYIYIYGAIYLLAWGAPKHSYCNGGDQHLVREIDTMMCVCVC